MKLEKLCSTCKLIKPIKDFFKDKSRKDGLQSHCKLCHNLSIERWKTKNKEKYLSSKRRWRLANREKERFYERTLHGRFVRAKASAKYIKRLWQITEEEFKNLISQPCYYCGGPLNKTGSGLDRINSFGNYEILNVRPCCDICNSMKNDTLEIDFRNKIKQIYERLFKNES